MPRCISISTDGRETWPRYRCVVARGFQKKGLGTILMHELVAHAHKEGVHKITAKMMDSQVSAQNAFKKLGFRKESS